jgi:hypothetical protein
MLSAGVPLLLLVDDGDNLNPSGTACSTRLRSTTLCSPAALGSVHPAWADSPTNVSDAAIAVPANILFIKLSLLVMNGIGGRRGVEPGFWFGSHGP